MTTTGQAMNLGEQVRTLRRASGLSQSDLAERVGCSYQTISQIETGGVENPHSATLLGLAEALGTTVRDLTDPNVRLTVSMETGLVVVDDDAMSPELRAGDRVELSDARPTPGDLVAIEEKPGHVTVRRLYKGDVDALVPISPRYSTLDANRTEHRRICKVVREI